jgi:hypothetical protein
MTVGGVPTSIAAWFAFFWLVRGAVAEYQYARGFRMRRKMRSARHRRLDRTRAAALAENESEGS